MATPLPPSAGSTPTEQLLFSLCQKTFLRLWSFANPRKDDGKEFCDLLAIFDGRVFIFFDRESRILDASDKEIEITWPRWKKAVVDKQIATANGAERYLRSGRKLFLDHQCTKPIPVPIPSDPKIHKVVVAHGAEGACKAYSEDNVFGSLAVSYGPTLEQRNFPFMVDLLASEKVHLLDSHNLEIVFRELDTFWDFSAYLLEKERAIDQYRFLSYCGEEDLLAHYFSNYVSSSNSYRIGTDLPDIDGLHIGEGDWQEFEKSERYVSRKLANKDSQLWDGLIQRTSENYLAGIVGGGSELFAGSSAIREMAREPRISRRRLSSNIIEKIRQFPENLNEETLARHMSVMPSFFADTMYVFLQHQPIYSIDYEKEYRPVRRHMLEVACGVTKNKFPHLKKVVGIAIDAPKFARGNSEDFVLLECETWTDEEQQYFEEENRLLRFYETENLTQSIGRTTDFPSVGEAAIRQIRPGRNDPCPCRSGKKYKKCCIRFEKRP